MKKNIFLFMLLMVLLLFVKCGQVESTDNIIEIPIQENDRILENESRTDLIQFSKQILKAIKEKKWSEFASYIHPTKGVRFSPYAYIDTNEQIVLNMNDFIQTMDDSKKWGTYDGSGEEIILTTKDYFNQFVYDVDFINAEQIKQDTLIGKGNSLNNLKEIYPSQPFIECYFSGFDEQYQGMDWRSLRLVFEKYENSYFLISIIHDQWTI